ncbi:hypothetical protein [Sulfurimonas sp.]|uniref:hypothetical protein n=1 Tax=Sulfurimonas sp. TaxID=2022749 RepID=UPI0025ECD87D|nr:hypothetical protein [Sulfurimonas sp.]
MQNILTDAINYKLSEVYDCGTVTVNDVDYDWEIQLLEIYAVFESFEKWWYNEGSGFVPDLNEDTEEFMKRVTKIAWLNGAYIEMHVMFENEIEITFMNRPSLKTKEKILMDIHYELKRSKKSGSELIDDTVYCWKIKEPIGFYLKEKIKILEEKEEVFFEHNQKLYQVLLRSDGDYEYNEYDLEDFASGDTLEGEGGVCSGSARDAIFTAIGE